MNEAKYPSKERVERDGVLVFAEGDDLINDPEEATRQGYTVDEDTGEVPVSKERVERDGVLVYSEGDVIPADDTDELARQGYLDKDASNAVPAKRAKKAAKS